ncbi:ArnT family glycosyltransferase [Paenibacillus humicus]|uniref:ArnT family glycosyltransferase n=1 Tax=Paenibacillus humicus TaxID=412861 RepID=UPI000FDB6A9A|nr:glycosyltransferase family 39 protein [Paenibacillus humicus]
MKIRERAGSGRRLDLVLAAAMLASAFLNLYGIGKETYANTYYTTAVGSMLQSWHNFFYGSLDSAGSVTVDKPPLAFWIQTAFAYVFGLHGWSVILPQALAGIGSVLLVYLLVKPSFGLAAARIAAFGMALAPVGVAVARTNNIDAMLVFTLLLAAWFLLRGVRGQRTGSLLASFALIGAAFNMKMLQAYMVLPAFYLLYLLAVRFPWKKKLTVLAGATVLMLAVSVSWAAIVDSVPADKRPYIGSSTDNSVLQLAFGYNGVSRLTGDRSPGGQGGAGGFPGAMAPDGALPEGSQGQGGMLPGNEGGAGQDGQAPNGTGVTGQDGPPQSDRNGADGQSQRDGSGRFERAGGAAGIPGGFGGNGGRAGGMFGTGEKGPLRLFQQALSGQASWLLPFALIAAVALLSTWRRKSMTEKHKETLFWLAWLIPVGGFFSIAGFFHSYYLIMLAPPAAALFGAGWSEMWAKYRQGRGWQIYLLPGAVAATSMFQWYILRPYESTIGVGWSLAVAGLGLLAALILAVLNSRDNSAAVRWTAAAAAAVLLIGPAYWSATPIVYGQNSMIPAAGPDGQNGMGGGRGGFAAAGSRTGGQWEAMNGGQGGWPNASERGGRPNASGQRGMQGGLQGQPGSAGDGGSEGFSGFQGAGGGFPGQAGGFQGMPGGAGGMGGSESLNEGLLAYLKQNQTTDYLLAVSDYGTAAPYIVEAKQKVVILHGFQNSDPVYDSAKLEQLVKSGKLKYFLVGGSGGAGGRDGGSDLNAWIEEHGKAVDASEYGGSPAASPEGETSGSAGPGRGSAVLYEVTLD